MATERTYTIPLRKYWIRVQKYKRAKRAINGLREFLSQHMKSDNIKLGKHLNLFVWKHSIQNPPSRVKVNVTKDDKNVVMAELFGAPKEEPKKEAKKKGIVGKVTDMVTGKKEAKKEEEEKSEKKEEKKPAKTEVPAPKPLVVEKSPKKPTPSDSQAMNDLAESAKKLSELTKKAPKAK